MTDPLPKYKKKNIHDKTTFEMLVWSNRLPIFLKGFLQVSKACYFQKGLTSYFEIKNERIRNQKKLKTRYKHFVEKIVSNQIYLGKLK